MPRLRILTPSAEPLGDLAKRIEGELTSFACGVPFADDRTLVLLRRTPGSGD